MTLASFSRLLCYLTVASTASAADRELAFPGAEGAGKWTQGGRRGHVVEVTNLDNDGPGSLRTAVDMREPRVITFRVSGTIHLQSALRVLHPFITIDGSSAPGDGITLAGHEFQIGTTRQVIVRHLRVRTGDKSSKASEFDAITIFNAQDVIVDHCTAMWSTDECLSVTNDSDRITVQHCLIAEALTEHSYGSIIASTAGDISFLHNLYACNRSRNPRPGSSDRPDKKPTSGPSIDFRNNVIFNWEFAAGYTGSGQPTHPPERIAINYVGNYLKPGPDTQAAYRSTAFTVHQGAEVQAFVQGNHVEGAPHAEPFVVRDGGVLTQRAMPFDVEAPTAIDAKAAYERVLREAGCTLPVRDAVDTRIIEGVTTGLGRIRLTMPE
jgi:hypothetical protein